MMIHAYQEIYLNKAQSILGDVFEFAINTCGISGNDFVKLFSMSTVSKRMENGEPDYISGKSGNEIAIEILKETKNVTIDVEAQEHFGRSREYWIGWAICYYQWYSCNRYSDIFKALSFDDLELMYDSLHEADISKFIDITNERMKLYFPETKLKYIRTCYGITQAELAKQSGVSIRSIQMYEQRNKNINKASVETVYRLSRILGCTMEDLYEKQL